MTKQERFSTTAAAIVGALTGLLVGSAVVLGIVPVMGNDSQPPTCYATFGTTVPCGSEPSALGAAAVAALASGFAAFVLMRRLPARRLKVAVTVE